MLPSAALQPGALLNASLMDEVPTLVNIHADVKALNTESWSTTHLGSRTIQDRLQFGINWTNMNASPVR